MLFKVTQIISRDCNYFEEEEVIQGKDNLFPMQMIPLWKPTLSCIYRIICNYDLSNYLFQLNQWNSLKIDNVAIRIENSWKEIV